MLIRGIRGLVSILGSLIFITSFLVIFKFYDKGSQALPYIAEKWRESEFLTNKYTTPDFTSSVTNSQDSLTNSEDADDTDEFDLNVYGKPAHEVFSVSTRNRKYFPIVFGEYESMNPSILPHPELEETYIIIGQQQRTDVKKSVWFAQLVCNAKFRGGKLMCIKSPLILPIPSTWNYQDTCTEDLGFLAFNVGPHDARAFYGPSHPYTIYGSQGTTSCFGLWIQDLRLLTDWGIVPAYKSDTNQPFRISTELQRPPPAGKMEKNWFAFWDASGQMYIHYDISPKRAFAQVSADGSAGPDLAPHAELEDEKCLTRYMPKLAPSLESIHQATNSLSVTLCKRNDPGCQPNDSNTFIMHIFQHKTFYNFHSVYEPYVVLFKQNAPFAVHGVSTKPIWIHGRGRAKRPKGMGADEKWDETEMFYITSMSWKAHGSKYHGYIDDEIFIGFGIEDKRSAGIDVVVGDILDHMGWCLNVDSEIANMTPDTAPPADLSALGNSNQNTDSSTIPNNPNTEGVGRGGFML